MRPPPLPLARPWLIAVGGHDAVPRAGVAVLRRLVAMTSMQDLSMLDRANAHALLASVTDALDLRDVDLAAVHAETPDASAPSPKGEP